MAEGYVLTSALDLPDLVAQLASQASSRGWVLHANNVDDLGRRRIHLSKDGVYANLCAALGAASIGMIPSVNRIPGQTYSWSINHGSGNFSYPDILGINVGTGFNGSLPWAGQPGAHTHSPDQPNVHRFRTIRAKGSIGRVHMFFYENPAAFYVICEVRAGEYYWFGAGNIDKNRPWGGGQFYGASLGDTSVVNSAYPVGMNGAHLRCTESQALPGFGNDWGGWFANTDRSVSWTSPASSANPPSGEWVPQYVNRYVSGSTPNDDRVSHVQRGYDPGTGRMWVQPPRTYINREGGGKVYLGVVPHVHFATTSHFVGGEVVTIGGVQYMILPWNWRQNPYNWDVTTVGVASGAEPYFLRNNNHGSGWALRVPE